MEIEEEEEGKVPTTFLYGAGAVMVAVGLVLVSVFVFRLQPPVTSTPAPSTGIQKGVANIAIPDGVGSNTALDFSPANATIVIGVNNTVVWTNQDTSPHTVVAKAVPGGASSFSSPILSKGATFNITLTVPGTYRYFCSLHPAWMQAVLTVKQASGAGGGQSPAGVTVILPSGVGASNALNYNPQTITVVIGVNNTVTWVNQDSPIHTVTATDGSFNSGNMNAGATFAHKFTTPGTFTYTCIYHSWMKGTVVVRQGS